VDANGAAQLLANAVRKATELKLPWYEKRVTLQPSPDLSRLVVESRTRAMTASVEA
jgi:hypothetical protein